MIVLQVRHSESRTAFTENFLRRHCPDLRTREAQNAVSDIAFQTISLKLDAAQKTNKKKQPPSVRKPKRKLLSHKERRKLKVFDIAEDKQR